MIGHLIAKGLIAATLLLTPAGQPAAGRWQQWVNTSQVPTPQLAITLEPAAWCGQPPAGGCSDVGPPWRLAATTRYSLYYELGHIYDASTLTWRDRGMLAHVWGAYGAPWNDSSRSLVLGEEDGLAVDFAAAYAACASGQHPQYLQSGWAPAIRLGDTCRLIHRIG